ITARVPRGTTQVALRYQLVDPGKYIDLKDAAYQTNWGSLLMNERTTEGAGKTGEGVYTAELPASLQQHRRLVRYRITALGPAGETLSVPAADDTEPNFAYFVYDGIPAWSGAIEPKSSDPNRSQLVQFDPAVMASV